MRGIFQGFSLGLYNSKKYILPAKCLSKDALTSAFYIEKYLMNFDWAHVMQIMYLVTSVYVNVDQECKIEDTIYDLSCFCFDHDCSWQTLLQNEMGKVFQVTGSLNSLAALFYDPEPNKDDH